ncbi:uncharacterized protein LOC108950103 [Ciona intestinalis]
MTPLSDEETVAPNYTGEAKTGNLMLCTDVGSMHNEKVKEPTSLAPALNSRLSALRNGPTRPKREIFPRSSLPGNKPNSKLPRLVKVSVYTKAVNPYMVIHDSNRKYAKPVACIKLINSDIKRTGNDNDVTDDREFQIHRHHDVDGSGVVTFRAMSSEKCDEWVDFLQGLTGVAGGQSSRTSGYIPGSSVLPTLVEQEDIDSENAPSAESLKAPARRKSREGRRNSLNSLGIRLRCYSIGKQR